MFLKFVVTMAIADFVCILVFSLVMVAVFAPFMLIARNESALKVAAVPMTVIGGSLQVYFWGLWGAYCAGAAIKFSAMPVVSHHWVYYVIAFMFCTAPLGYLASREIGTAQDSGEARSIQRGSSIFGTIAIVAFILFCIWPNLTARPYSWALAHVL